MKTGFLIASLLLATAAGAQAAERDSIRDFVNAYITKNRIPGVALMVRRQGRVVRAEGYGMANLEHRVPVKPETVFQSGSMGKQFTSMAVMTLVEEEACFFEHILSPVMTDSICGFLNHPPACPHGKPIPRGECCRGRRVEAQ